MSQTNSKEQAGGGEDLQCKTSCLALRVCSQPLLSVCVCVFVDPHQLAECYQQDP